MKEQIKQSIGSKMQVSERPRPTPVQLAYVWVERAKEEGKNYGEVIDVYISEYNMDSTDRKLVTYLEADVVKVLPLQTEECQNKIEYHWQNFKPKESAIPLHYLGNKAWTNGSVQRPVSCALWKEIQRTPDKRAACVFRWIGVFVANIKNATRLKKKVNLKASAKTVRCDRSPETAYEMAALFTHFAPQFMELLTEKAWQQVLDRFRRGALDKELYEKVMTKDPDLNVHSFRFVEQSGVAKPEQRSVSSSDQAITEAETNLQRQELETCKLKLGREAKKWRDFLEAVRIWRCKCDAARGDYMDTQEQQNNKAIKKHADLVYPVRELMLSDHVPTFVHSSVQAWADAL
jgi:hypothetical protein